MIICSTSNVDLIHGVIGYGNVSDGTTDWRITNTKTAVVGQTGIFNILNSTSVTPNFTIIETGNIGIGTSTNITNKLQLYNDFTSSTTISITNNNIANNTPVITPTGTGTSTIGQITSSTDRFMIFTAGTSSFTIPFEGITYDILMIGGGGGAYAGGGGGSGACIVAINQLLPVGECIVSVGGGGGSSSNGIDSSISVTVSGTTTTRYLAKGGGAGGIEASVASDGGCGGGANHNITAGNQSGGIAVSTNVVVNSSGIIITSGQNITETYAILGNDGGSNGTSINSSAGSGGGIGAAGVTGGKGGDGLYQVTLTTTPPITLNFRNYFANGSTTFGVQDGSTGNYYIGGGGTGYLNYVGYVKGALGGGGGGSSRSGVANTGSGGCGGNQGGSGIVIIRYRLPSTLGTPSIELIRGTAGDSNTDFKLGNYNGNFKVISTSLSSDTDRLNISSSGNIGIGITNPAVKLQVLGGDIACSGDIISYYSDERLKTKLSNIKDPLKIINELNGFYYIPNDLARTHGITNTRTEVGLSAQDVQKVLPEIVKIAPFDLAKDENDNNVSKSGENYLTLSYDRLAPIFVEAIKELSMANKELNEKYNRLLETISNNK